MIGPPQRPRRSFNTLECWLLYYSSGLEVSDLSSLISMYTGEITYETKLRFFWEIVLYRPELFEGMDRNSLDFELISSLIEEVLLGGAEGEAPDEHGTEGEGAAGHDASPK